jgi:hypothetical protein
VFIDHLLHRSTELVYDVLRIGLFERGPDLADLVAAF